jgi:hypothetical protein
MRRGLILVKTIGGLSDEREEGCGTGPKRGKTVLREGTEKGGHKGRMSLFKILITGETREIGR